MKCLKNVLKNLIVVLVLSGSFHSYAADNGANLETMQHNPVNSAMLMKYAAIKCALEQGLTACLHQIFGLYEAAEKKVTNLTVENGTFIFEYVEEQKQKIQKFSVALRTKNANWDGSWIKCLRFKKDTIEFEDQEICTVLQNKALDQSVDREEQFIQLGLASEDDKDWKGTNVIVLAPRNSQ